MEAKDFLYRISCDFFLGKYFDVIEGFQDYSSSSSFGKDSAVHFEILCLLQKALTHALRNCEGAVGYHKAVFTEQEERLNYFLKYYAPALISCSSEEAKRLLEELAQEAEPQGLFGEHWDLLKKIFTNYINATQRNYTSLNPVPITFKESFIEYQSMIFTAFEHNNQHREADKVIEDLKLVDDEHIAVALMEVRRFVRNEEWEKAQSKIAEIGEKFGESLKLQNLNYACQLGRQHFEEVGLQGFCRTREDPENHGF